MKTNADGEFYNEPEIDVETGELKQEQKKRKFRREDDVFMDLSGFKIYCSKNPVLGIIFDYAEEKRLDYKTKFQWRAFIRRNIRAAEALTPYTKEQIGKAMAKINEAQGTYLKKWTLETLVKYLDEV